MQSVRSVKSFRRLWQAWSHLSKAEQRASLIGLVAIPAMAAGARMFGFERVLGWSKRVQSRGGSQRCAEASVREIERGTRRAARRGFYAGNCLSQSLTLLWLIRREGFDAELVLGARLVDSRLEAHAWVECDRIPINEHADVRTQFAALESNGWGRVG